jgi:hypothetical protein
LDVFPKLSDVYLKAFGQPISFHRLGVTSSLLFQAGTEYGVPHSQSFTRTRLGTISGMRVRRNATRTAIIFITTLHIQVIEVPTSSLFVVYFSFSQENSTAASITRTNGSHPLSH